jgi:hypothetical protein
MLRIVGAVLLIAALAVEDLGTMADRAEDVGLRHEDLDFIPISGYDNLCLFNSFAHGTELRPAELRTRVCEFMRTNPTTAVGDGGISVRDYVAFENSSMNRLNVRTMRYDGAGLAVAASLATMLQRNLEVYEHKQFDGESRQGSEIVYVQILKVTVDRTAPVLMLRFSRGGCIGHFNIMRFKQSVHARSTAAGTVGRPVQSAQPVASTASPKATKMAMPEKPSLMKKPPSKRAPAKRIAGATRGAMAATRQRDPDVEGVHDENDVSSAAAS